MDEQDIIDQIFAAEAEKFRDWGASPLPLKKYVDDPVKAKEPVISSWQSYCRSLVSTLNLNKWMRQYPDHNIGLAMGMLFGERQLIALDFDDDRLIPFGRALLGGFVCSKRGGKGITTFALADKTQKSKRHRLHNQGKPAVEILAIGSYTVMPNSIHPDGVRYQHIDCNPLYTYKPEELSYFTPEMTTAMEIVVESEHTPVILSGEGTHDATLALVAQLLAAGVSKDLILRSVPALFPEHYKGNSLNELPGMVDSAIAKGFQKPSNAPDIRIAKELIDDLHPIIYVPEEGFLKYKDGHWGHLPDEEFEKLALEKMESAFGNRLVAPMIAPVKKVATLLTHRKEFGKFSTLVCCRNGTVDVLTGELLPWLPEHQLRYQLGIEYDPEATCPLYDKHVSQTLLGDEQAIAAYDEFAGYSLIPDNRMQKALYLIGEGGSGKGILLKLVIAMHDEQAVCVTSLTKIDDERHITNLSNKLLCVSMDIQPKQNAVAYGEGFVRITGGDRVTTRRLYEEVKGNVQTPVRFMGSMNKLPPKFIAAPDALKRRLIFLQCGPKVEKEDTDFISKLLAEQAGIFARWLKALKRLMERGQFNIPEASRQLVDEYLQTQDPVQCFVDECLERDTGEATSVDDLFISYSIWAEQNKEQQFSKNVFGKHLQSCGLKSGFKKMRNQNGKEKNTRVYFVHKTSPLNNQY